MELKELLAKAVKKWLNERVSIPHTEIFPEAKALSLADRARRIDESLWSGESFIGYLHDIFDEFFVVKRAGRTYVIPYTMENEEVVTGEMYEATVTYTKIEREEQLFKGSPEGGNFKNNLKAVPEASTEDELVVENYIVLFGDESHRDLEGLASDRKNADGSAGEFFTKNTEFESDYTQNGVLNVDWEHGVGTDGLGKDDVLGYVDWKNKSVDERGVFVRRVLNRRKKYVQFLEELINKGLIGTSSEPVQNTVQKSSNGEIVKWGLKRDSLTVSPMEWRMIRENNLVTAELQQAVKALGLQDVLNDGLDNNEGVVASESGEYGGSAETRDEKLLKALQLTAELLLEEIKNN